MIIPANNDILIAHAM